MPSSADPARVSAYWHVRVQPKSEALDGYARDVLADIHRAGFHHVRAVRSSRLFFLLGRLDESTVRLIAEDLLTDPVAETFAVGAGIRTRTVDAAPSVEVHRLPGVMNPLALSTIQAVRDLLSAGRRAGAASVEAVQTARRYEIIGARDGDELERIAAGVLANDCIETWYIRGFDRADPVPETFPAPPEHPFVVHRTSLTGLSDDDLQRLSRRRQLFLDLDEMRAIRDHFARLVRDPTDLELETLAQTWSEHCIHKTLRSAVRYRGDAFGGPGTVEVRFDNLLKDTIMAATRSLERPWCLSVFEDNAGVIAFDDDLGLAFKVETHNHPSAIEPYGGAATGTGGCIRDIMGCGLGAKPIASTDVFCLAPPDHDPAQLPADVLHPRRVLKGVVAGVRDYGNRMGIPTVNGAVHFDPRFLANPLVFCGCVGLIPRDRIAKRPRAGDRIILAGGRTGRDGIHGATFSSSELTDNHADEFSHAVQIGHAIEEKKLLDALLLARDHPDGCLYTAVTDCGAGGLSSAVGEMGEHLGAVVDLEKVPLKYAGLRYDEIWISEAQERMVFAVSPGRVDTMLELFAREEVEATVIGTFSDDKVLRVRYRGETVGELEMALLHGGRPERTLSASWSKAGKATASAQPLAAARAAPAVSAGERLIRALADPGTASKEWIIRQYDHEVQGRSVIKPLVGPGIGPSDAAVLRPRYDSHRGVAVACGLGITTEDDDPYLMAVAAVDEALRNVVCVGADPGRTAILDNFCWPKVDSEESLGALVRACRGAADAAVAYGLPFISGKDSLNNEFVMSAAEAARTGLPERIAIPYTLLISAVGIVNDIRRCVTMDLKRADSSLVLASSPVITSAEAPQLDAAKKLHDNVAGLIAAGRVLAAHDVSDGGLAVTVAEMCIAGACGASVDVASDLAWCSSRGCDHDSCGALFEPITTSYVLEMTKDGARASGLPVIGTTQGEPRLGIALDGAELINLPVADLATAWRKPLADGGGS